MQIDDGKLEESLGFPQFNTGAPRLGWLMNFNAVRCRSFALLPGVLHPAACLRQCWVIERKDVSQCLAIAGTMSVQT